MSRHYRRDDNRIENLAVAGTTFLFKDIDQHISNQTTDSGAEVLRKTIYSPAVLHGYAGDDTYVYDFGNGDIAFSEQGSSHIGYGGADTLVFEGVSFEHIALHRQGKDLVFSVARDGISETVRIKNHFYNGDRRNNATAIEKIVIDGRALDIELAERHVFNNDPLRHKEVHNTPFSTHLSFGYAASNNYVHAAGNGDAVISDKGGQSDKLVINGVTGDQVNVGRDGQDLLLLVASERGVETIRIQNHFAGKRIEKFEIGGTTYDHRSTSTAQCRPALRSRPLPKW